MNCFLVSSYEEILKESTSDSQFLFIDLSSKSTNWVSKPSDIESCTDLTAIINGKSVDIEKLIDDFFVLCQRYDPNFDYGFTSKVLLSIPLYKELISFFKVLFCLIEYPNQRLLILCDEPLVKVLISELYAGETCKTSVVVMPLVKRFFRSFLRMFNPVRGTKNRLVSLSLSHGANGDVNDSYFSDLHVKHEDLKRVYLASGKRFRLHSDSNSTPLEAYASLTDLFCVLYLSLKAQVYPAQIMFKGYDLSFLYHRMAYSEHENGSFFNAKLIERVARKVFRSEGNDVLLLPYENRSWEKKLINSAKVCNIRQVIGYQHSSLTPRHLAFKFSLNDVPAHFVPDRIVTVGQVTADYIKRNAPSLSSIVVAGASLRRSNMSVQNTNKLNSVLIPISSSRSEAASLLRVVWEALEETELGFVIRTHPTIPINDLFEQYDWPDRVVLSSGMTLAEDIQRTSIIAYSSSTVALDGMLVGRLVIFVDIGDIPSGDPLLNNTQLRQTVRNGGELAAAVNALSRLQGEDYEFQKTVVRDYAENYLVSTSTFGMSKLASLFELGFR